MRSLAVLLVASVLLPGCFGAGLGSSTTNCNTLPVGENGFLFTISDPTPLVGRCVQISRDGEQIDEPLALSKLPADGRVFLPVEGAGKYYVSVRAADPNDKYCADSVGEFPTHPGSGIVEVQAMHHRICA